MLDKPLEAKGVHYIDIEEELWSLEQLRKAHIVYEDNLLYNRIYRYPVNGNYLNGIDLVQDDTITRSPNLATVLAEIAKFYIINYAAASTTLIDLLSNNPLIEKEVDFIYPRYILEYDPKEFIRSILPSLPDNNVIQLDRQLISILRPFFDIIDNDPNVIYDLDITQRVFKLIAKEDILSFRYREALAYQKSEEDKYDKKSTEDEVPPLDIIIEDYFNNVGFTNYYNDVITIDLSMLDNIRFSKVIEPSRFIPQSWIDKLSIRYDALVLDVIIEKYFHSNIANDALSVVRAIIDKLEDQYEIQLKISPQSEIDIIKYVEFCYKVIAERINIYINGMNVIAMGDDLDYIFNTGLNFYVYNTYKITTAPDTLMVHVVVNSYRLK